MRIAVIRFPGSNCDLDTLHVLKNVFKATSELVWHKEFKGVEYDAAILPGGFSYGDYLRAGAIAAHSPALLEVGEMAREGKPILGICNGFQILVEAGLLPGALLPNTSLAFICRWVRVRCETRSTPFTRHLAERAVLNQPIAHKEGRYFNEAHALREMETNNQIVFRYVDEEGETTEKANPNGSLANIAGVANLEGNVVGLMPHPERSSEGILTPKGEPGGFPLFNSLIKTLGGRRAWG